MLNHPIAHIRNHQFQRFARWSLLALAVGLQANCATTSLPTARAHRYDVASLPAARRATVRVDIMQPVLAERIEQIARQSPSFRDAWDMIRRGSVRVRIGSYSQLRSELPRWYRNHPNDWAGVTVLSSNGGVSSAVVALRLSLLEQLSQDLPAGNTYVTDEIDRLLIHEIYGHLAPVVASGQECPDQVRPGETSSCVKLREQRIAAELGSTTSVR